MSISLESVLKDALRYVEEMKPTVEELVEARARIERLERLLACETRNAMEWRERAKEAGYNA